MPLVIVIYLVTKRGNENSILNGGFSGKIIHKYHKYGGISIAMFEYQMVWAGMSDLGNPLC